MRLKSNLILSLMLLSFVINAQEKYSNRWKEVKRTDRKDKPVAYTDTMLINNVTKESLKMRKGSFEYNGTISNDLLEVGEEQYQFIMQSETEIRIGDDDYIHIFKRELKDQSAADSATAMNENRLPQKPVMSIDTALLKGDWQAYKRNRKDNQPGKINYKNLIKTVSFHNNATQGSYGTIITNNTLMAYTIIAWKNSEITYAGNNDNSRTHSITVWKLTQEELVIEDEGNIIYYMKQF